MDGLVIIDYQNYLRRYDPEKYADNIQATDKAIAKTVDLINTAREAGQDIIIVAYTGNENDIYTDNEAGIIPDIRDKLTSNDTIFTKTQPSAYGSVDIQTGKKFEELLKDKGYEKIFFAGSSIMDCVQKTVDDVMNDEGTGKPIFIRDCCDPSPKFTGGQSPYFANRDICSAERLKRHWLDNKPLSHIPFNKFASVHDPVSQLETIPHTQATTPRNNFSK